MGTPPNMSSAASDMPVFNQARASLADRAASTNPKARSPNQSGVSTGTHSMRAMGDEGGDGAALPFLQDRKKLTIAGSVLGAIVFTLIIAAALKKPAEPTKTDVASAPAISQPVAAPSPAPSMPAAPTIAAPGIVKPLETTTAPVTNTQPQAGSTVAVPSPTPEAANPSYEATKAAAKATAPKDAPPDAAKASAAKLADQGTMRLSIDPWGEVFVNGRSIGVSPPVKQHKLVPGKYKIEVKNRTFTPYVTNIEVKAKEDVAVKYKFQ